ncbi:MAG: proline dehydrogenase family protein [Gemmatimonadota bacterium]
MPGEELDDALTAAEGLGKDGLSATVTLLGENLESLDEADAVVEHYLGALRDIRARGVDAEVSVKLTQLGLDFGADAAGERLARLVEATDSLLWVDMEGSPYVDATLDVFKGVRAKRANVGLCLQAYLYRTEKDLEGLLGLDPSIRVVKGAYREPADVAFPKKADVDRAFVKLTARLLRARAQGGSGRPVVATHDPRMLAEASRLAHELGLERSKIEYSMLFGIAAAEQRRLVRGGNRVRVLISYGPTWFPWYMRRLAERPANLWFVVKQLLG